MLKTIEAEIHSDGTIEPLEPINVTVNTRSKVTYEEQKIYRPNLRPNGAAMLKVLKDNPLPPSSRRSAKEIEDGIEELRNSWD